MQARTLARGSARNAENESSDPEVPPALVRIAGLAKSHRGVEVFRGASLSIDPGEFVALRGESGVGKSTLLNCIAGLVPFEQGELRVAGIDLRSAGDDELARLRREKLGFVFQAFHLLPHLDLATNVALPLMLLGRPDPARVQELLAAVGLASRARHSPASLSGGELQRVAIARALVHRPALILADEPTGNLDPVTADRVMDLLAAQIREAGAACLLVTHSKAAASRADRVLTLKPTGIFREGPGAS